MLEKNDTDARYRIDHTGTCQTLKARMGTGGNNVPILIEVKDESGIQKVKEMQVEG